MNIRCVGCGAEFEKQNGPTHRYIISSPGCWARYGELLALLSADHSLQSVRIMCVDAYAIQHPGTQNPQSIQSVATHLINMYEYLVLGRAVRTPRVVHKGTFHWLTPPTVSASRTVSDMPRTAVQKELADAAHAWTDAVWSAWSQHHQQVSAWAEQHTRT